MTKLIGVFPYLCEHA